MAERAGSTVFDISGFGHHGTLTNMDAGSDWVLDQFGPCLDFDPASGNQNVKVTTDDFKTTDATWSCWVKRVTDPSPVNEYILNYGADIFSRFIVRVNSGNLDVHDDIVNEGETNTLGSGVFNLGSWHHVAIRFEGGVKEGYADGILQGTDSTGSALTSISGTGVFQIGNIIPDSSNNVLQGRLDEVRVYNRSLAASEILSLAREPFLEFEDRPRSVKSIVPAASTIDIFVTSG